MKKKVWKLDVSVSKINIEELACHLGLPFWSSEKGFYDLKPIDVLNFKEKYKEEYERIQKADISFPIDVMENKGKLVILDGLHRLAKLYLLGEKEINVRIIDRKFIDKIKF